MKREERKVIYRSFTDVNFLASLQLAGGRQQSSSCKDLDWLALHICFNLATHEDRVFL
jgi:hypothetical protein